MNILQGLLMGIIQGLTEFLPVSSSGHLSLFQYFTGNAGAGSNTFNLMLHLGTLAAVIAAYYEDLWALIKEFGALCRDLFRGQFEFKTQNPNRKMLYMLFFACLPLVLALLLNGLADRVSGDNDIVVEGVCFLFTSALLFIGCKARRGRAGILKMKPRHAVTIGVAQAVATLPGISRSGATISTGLFLGFDRAFMVKFSFLMGIPTILGGVLFKAGDSATNDIKIPFWPLFVGMLAAAVVGYVSIRLIRWLVLSDKFVVFAWYTLVLGVVVLALGIAGHLLGWNPAAGADPSSVAASISQSVSGSGSVPPG